MKFQSSEIYTSQVPTKAVMLINSMLLHGSLGNTITLSKTSFNQNWMFKALGQVTTGGHI